MLLLTVWLPVETVFFKHVGERCSYLAIISYEFAVVSRQSHKSSLGFNHLRLGSFKHAEIFSGSTTTQLLLIGCPRYLIVL